MRNCTRGFEQNVGDFTENALKIVETFTENAFKIAVKRYLILMF